MTASTLLLRDIRYVCSGVLGGGPARERGGVCGEALGQATMGEQCQRGHSFVVRVPAVSRALPSDQKSSGRAQLTGAFLDDLMTVQQSLSFQFFSFVVFIFLGGEVVSRSVLAL